MVRQGHVSTPSSHACPSIAVAHSSDVPCTLLSATCHQSRTRCRMLRLAAMHSSSFARAANGSILTHLLSTVSAFQPMGVPHSLPLPMELQEAQRGFWFNTLSKDTIAAYQTRKAKWIEFSTRFQRSPNDLSPKNIVDYITYLATIAKRGETPLSYASIKVYVDFLGRATSFTSPLLPNPVQHPEVQLFLRGVARTLGKQVAKQSHAPWDI
jgi:hypothetical protein